MKIAIITIMILISLIGTGSAIEVHIFSNQTFETEAFAPGQEILITATVDNQPVITVEKQNIFKEEMVFKGNALYEYRLTPSIEGTYNVRVSVGNDSVDKQFFVASDLDINWGQVEEDYIEKEVNNTASSANIQKDELKVKLTMGGTFFERFCNWLKIGIGDRREI